MSGGETFVCERENLIFDTFIDFQPVERFESRSDMRELGSFNNCTSERVLDDGCVDGAGCFDIKADTTELTNVEVAGLRKCSYLVRKRKVFIRAVND